MYQRKKYLAKLLERRNNSLVKIITGARRVGKSYLMNIIFYNELLKNGFSEDHIIKFAFDKSDDQDKLDNYLVDQATKIYYKKDQYYINAKKFRAYIRDQIKDNDEYIFLLDEIQLLDDFVGTLNSFLDNPKIDIYVTGSNSHLLSSDIDTKFRGRGISLHVLPLSFKEFYEENAIDINQAYNLYTKYGGLPLITILNNNEDKYEQLKSIANETYLKDIINRYGIKNTSDLDDLYLFLASSIGSVVSPTKLANTFKSIKNRNICDETITAYIKYFNDSFIASNAKIYNIKGKKYINSPYKVYFEDVGIRNTIIASFGNDMGHILENVIYNDLRYKGLDVSIGQISYSETNSSKELVKIDSEIDFIATRENKKYYIQVCLNIDNESIYNREIKSLNKINDSFTKILIVKDGLFKRTTNTGIIIIDALEFLMLDNIEHVMF